MQGNEQILQKKRPKDLRDKTMKNMKLNKVRETITGSQRFAMILEAIDGAQRLHKLLEQVERNQLAQICTATPLAA